DTRQLPHLLSPPAGLFGPVLVSDHRAGAAGPDARLVPAGVLVDGALPRPEGPAWQPADALVLRDANHLPDAAGAGEHALGAQPEPDDAPRDLLPGGALLRRSPRPLALARRPGGNVRRRLPRRLFRLR